MAITRYTYRNPWRDLDQLTNRLGRIFGEDVPGNGSGSDWIPAVNVEETSEELVLTAELPGMKEEDIDVELENNVLQISGERSVERSTDDEERRYHLWERRSGSFMRSFTLPRTVQADDISAEFENGVLTVHMPKAPESRGRRIAIGSAAKK